jgi:hypothetical protein
MNPLVFRPSAIQLSSGLRHIVERLMMTDSIDRQICVNVLLVCCRQHRGAVLLVGCLVAAIVLVNSVVWPIATYYRSQLPMATSTQVKVNVVNSPDAGSSIIVSSISAELQTVSATVADSPNDIPGNVIYHLSLLILF